jgi:hypothetical protein
MTALRTSRAGRLMLLGTPLLFAGVSVFHPQDHPAELGGAVSRWMAVHLLQLVLSVLLSICIWELVDGIRSRAATAVRVAVPVWLVFFSAFDGVAGLATGWMAHTAHGQSGDEQDATVRAIKTLFEDNWITGNLSIAGSIAGLSWLVIAIGGAIALRRSGVDTLTVGLMAASLLFANHPPPTGTLGLLALAAVVYRTTFRRRSASPATIEARIVDR